MADFNLKMIKVSFLIVTVTVVVIMTSGMSIVKYSPDFKWENAKMNWDYWKYRITYAGSGQQSQAALAKTGAKARSIPVLLYHGVITDRDWEEDGTNITLQEFEAQMLALRKAGYRTVKMSEFADFMRGERELPDKSIMITFDDGRKDSYYEADPVFKALDFNAVMFLIAGRSLGKNSAGDNFYLGKGELESMIKSGRWEIQSHGDFDHDWMQIDSAGDKGHFMSNLLWIPGENRNETEDEAKNRILADLESSKKKISGELGQKIVAFAYPFNDFGQSGNNFPTARNFIAENIKNIYPLTFFQEEKNEPVLNFPEPNAFMIKRINVDSSIGTQNLLELLSQNREKTLPWNDTFWKDQGWRAKWGSENVWGDLNIGETEDRGGNMTVLLGSSLWENYFVASKVALAGGNSISQIVRYKDEENYAACNFEAGGVSITQKNLGADTVVAEKAGPYENFLRSDMEIGAEVKGNLISCYLNGNKELEGSLNPSNARGGIGYYFWNDLPEKTSARIKKIDVRPL